MRRGEDLRRVYPPRRRDHGASRVRHLQGHPHRQDTHTDQPTD